MDDESIYPQDDYKAWHKSAMGKDGNCRNLFGPAMIDLEQAQREAIMWAGLKTPRSFATWLADRFYIGSEVELILELLGMENDNGEE